MSWNDEEMDPKAQRPPRRPRNFVMPLVLLLGLALLVIFLGQNLPGSKNEAEISVAEFQEGKKDYAYLLERVDVVDTDGGGTLEAKVKDPGWKVKDEYFSRIRVMLPQAFLRDFDGFEKLREGISPEKFNYRRENPLFLHLLLTWIPWLALIFLFYFFFLRPLRSSGGPGNVLSFGKSRARFVSADKVKVTFDDVAGIEEAKEEVKEIIEFLKDPQKFQRLGGRIPHGVLLVGAPGTGKTLLAKAIAGEARVPFLSISGSDFVEMFVGVGASRVRDVFKTAKETSPCIIFLDEIDAVGRRRGTGLGGGHDEREQTLNQILVEMDGFDTDAGVIIIAATNRQDVLDPALLRPGRFDRQIIVDLPDVKGREQILRVHAKGIKLHGNVNLGTLAKATPMMSGADLASLINEAAILATMRKRDSVEMSDLEEARDKVLWGRQKKSRVVIEEEKKITAYHEAGHALVSLLLPECDPIHKVTIIPRGRMGGATMVLPEHDRQTYSEKYCLAQLSMLFGGRAAEEIFLEEVTTGAQNDIQRATELARRMVTEWGMSPELGPISYSDEEEHLFLGREISRKRSHSEEISRKIDQEVRRLVDQSHERARKLLDENRDKVEMLSGALLQYETISGKELNALLEGRNLDDVRREQEEKDAALSEEADSDGSDDKEDDPPAEPENWNPVPDPVPGN